MAAYPFVQAKHYRKGRDGARAIWVIIHTIEAPEKGTTAEACAQYFRTTTRPASAHYCVDSNSVVACVRESDQAAGAPGANKKGIHIEHAGYAKQTAAQWTDAYSVAMLARSAGLVADICKRHGIAPVWLSASSLKAGKSGISSHANCSKAFGGTHWDPGPGFPWQSYVKRVKETLMAERAAVLVVNGTPSPVKCKIEGGNTWIDLSDWCEFADYARPTYDPATGQVSMSTEKQIE